MKSEYSQSDKCESKKNGAKSQTSREPKIFLKLEEQNLRFGCDVHKLARTEMCCIQRSAFTQDKTLHHKRSYVSRKNIFQKKTSVFGMDEHSHQPGLMMALSDTLKMVIFCLGGTPAFLNISMELSVLCQSLR